MRNEFWFISTLISIGVIGGFVYNWPTSTDTGGADRQFPDSNTVTVPVVDQLSEEEIQGLTTRVAGHLRKADNFLIVGNFDDALEQYTIVLDINEDHLPDNSNDIRMWFRLGLANELNADYQAAEYFYRKAVSQVKASEHQRMIAELARTRNWINLGRNADALEVLTREYLANESDININEETRFSLGQQILDILRVKSMRLIGADTKVLGLPLFENCPIDIEGSLMLIDGQLAAQSAIEPDKNEIEISQADGPWEVLQNPNGDSELIMLRADSKSIAVAGLLTQLGELTKLQFQLNSKTKPHVVGRTVRVQSEAISLAVLLDVVLHPLHLVWQQDGQKIEVSTEKSLSRTELSRFRIEQAVRMGRHLVVNFPENRCRDAIRLAIANLEMLKGDVDAASSVLNQLLDEESSGELRAKVHLNLGQIEKKIERYDDAVKQFLLAVDQSLESDLRAIAYANIARVQIEQNYIEAAIVAGGRSVALTENKVIKSAAALDLARAYLISRDPQSANRILFEQDEAILDGRDKRLATVFGAYARTLGTLSPIAEQHAIETLVVALAAISVKELKYTVDRIIVADAYLSIGLTDRAIEALVITNAFPENEFWNRKRTFELARVLKASGKTDSAISNYEKLALDLRDLIGQRSLLVLAEYQLEEKAKPQKTIDLLKQLWVPTEDFEVEKADKLLSAMALRLMGKAYRKLGDLESAVYCFSGALPANTNQ